MKRGGPGYCHYRFNRLACEAIRCRLHFVRFIWLSPYKERNFAQGGLDWRSIVAGNILNSQGIHVAVVVGSEIYDLTGKKLYNLKGSNIYLPSGELVGHLNKASGSDRRLARSTDRLFPALRQRSSS